MSVHVMSWVFKHSTAEGTDRLCLLVLANYADEDGLSWPSVFRIAKEMRVSERTAQRVLHKLDKGGNIIIVPNGAPDSRQPANRKTNAYRLLSGPLPTLGAPRGDKDVTPPSGAGVTSDASRGDIPRVPGVTTVSPKPSLDPSVDPSTESGAKAPSSVNGRASTSAEKGPAKNGSAAKITPDTFVVTAEMRAWAAEAARGVDVDAQTEQFKDWWRASGGPAGKPYKDPVAGWRNWIRRSKPGGLAPWRQPDKTNRNPANVYGDKHRVGGGRRIQ